MRHSLIPRFNPDDAARRSTAHKTFRRQAAHKTFRRQAAHKTFRRIVSLFFKDNKNANTKKNKRETVVCLKNYQVEE